MRTARSSIAEKLEILRAAVDHVAGRVPVLSGVAEYTTRLACRFANDAEKIGVDGLMVLPAMVYKSDPRETIAHFRAVARSTGLNLMVYNNPVSYQVDVTPEMFGDLADETKPGGHQGIIRKRAPDHRFEECVRRSLHSFLRGRRPGAGEHSPGRHRVDLGIGQRVSGRRAPACGLWPPRDGGKKRERFTAGTRRSCISTPTSSWCSTSSWLSRNAASAQRWCAPRVCRSSGQEREEILAIIQKGIATRPELAGKTSRPKQVSSF